MGRAIPVPQRRVIFERAGRGHRGGDIAADLGLSRETVRKLIARFRTAGATAIAPDYSRCGARQPRRADGTLIAAAIAMRREHPTWGAGILQVLLAARHPGRALPGERTIQRALAAAGLHAAPPAAAPGRVAGPRGRTRPGRSTPPTR